MTPLTLMRIRHYGFLANRARSAKLARCRELFKQPQAAAAESETAEAFMYRVAGVDIHRCPHCQQGRLVAAYLLWPAATGPPGIE